MKNVFLPPPQFNISRPSAAIDFFGGNSQLIQRGEPVFDSLVEVSQEQCVILGQGRFLGLNPSSVRLLRGEYFTDRIFITKEMGAILSESGAMTLYKYWTAEKNESYLMSLKYYFSGADPFLNLTLHRAIGESHPEKVRSLAVSLEMSAGGVSRKFWRDGRFIHDQEVRSQFPRVKNCRDMRDGFSGINELLPDDVLPMPVRYYPYFEVSYPDISDFGGWTPLEILSCTASFHLFAKVLIFATVYGVGLDDFKK